jgi:hypothetical protein
MIKGLQFLFASILATAFFGCVKNVAIKPPSYTPKLSVQSLITPGDTPKVYLYRTVPYLDAKITARELFVTDASVTMSGGGTAISFRIDSSFNNIRCEYDYFWKGDRAIMSNTTYALSINTNGKILAASAVTNQRKAAIDSVGYIPSYKDLYGEHEGVMIHFKDIPGAGDNYRYRMGRNIFDSVVHAETEVSPCTIGRLNYVEEIGRSVYSDQALDGQDMSFVFEPTFTHKQGQEAYITLQTLDKNLFMFYDNLDRQKLAQFNPFVEPVFIQPGQFGSEVIGVFGAYAVSDSVKFVYPQ